MSAYRSLLSNSRLTRLLLGEGISAVGDWLYFVRMLVIVYDVAGDPFLLGLIGAARVVPYAVLSVPAGVLADGFDRRTIMLVTDGVRAVVMVVLAVLVATGAPTITIVALAIVSTTASAFFAPALAAHLPSLRPGRGSEARRPPTCSGAGIIALEPRSAGDRPERQGSGARSSRPRRRRRP